VFQRERSGKRTTEALPASSSTNHVRMQKKLHVFLSFFLLGLLPFSVRSFMFKKTSNMNIFRRQQSPGGGSDHTASPSPAVSLRASAVRGGLDARPDSKEDAERYNLLASVDVALSDAFVFQGILSVVRSTRDIDNKKRRRYLYTIPIPQGDGFFPFSIPPSEMSESIKARVPSPTGHKIAVLRQEAEETEQVLEIWTHECQVLENRIVLPSKKLHGKVVNDPNWFGRVSWNEDETALVYSAERKAATVTSFFDTEEDEKDEKVRGGQSTMGLGKTEDWGEKYTETSALLDLFVVNIETGKVGRVENVPGGVENTTTHGGFTLGQASFSPCGTHVVYTAWDAGGGTEMPRRLGMTYCMQRPSKIYASPINNLMEHLAQHDEEEKEGTVEKLEDEECLCLTQGARISRSARFAPEKDGISKLVYLCSKLGFDTHYGCMALHVQDWNVDECVPDLDSQNVWIPIVHYPPTLSGDKDTDIQVANMAFPGIYTQNLPLMCCTDDFLLTTTQWGSVQRIVRVSLQNGHMTLLNADIARGKGLSTEISASQSLLCVTADGGAVIMESAPNRPAIVAFVSREGLARDKVYIKVDAPLVAEMGPISTTAFSPVPRTLASKALDFEYEVLAMRPPQIEDTEDTKVQWILLRPKDQSDGYKPPLIVVPHGGPHSCTSTAYLSNYAFLCASGYCILHVNYRGSIGFGQGALDTLPGHVGLLDVKDVMHATVTMIDSGWVDPDRIGICGGSHGGFLAAHCIGQFPDLFKAAAMRNPVTNIASMLTATDIPDWCYVEALGSGYYNWKEYRSASREELDIMWEASPIKHAMAVETPTLIALGLEDKRVPPSQGREYYHVLRANGVITKLIMYDKDDHAIDKVDSEGDLWINIKQWFDRHL